MIKMSYLVKGIFIDLKQYDQMFSHFKPLYLKQIMLDNTGRVKVHSPFTNRAKRYGHQQKSLKAPNNFR